jgi:hypothetical protein
MSDRRRAWVICRRRRAGGTVDWLVNPARHQWHQDLAAAYRFMAFDMAFETGRIEQTRSKGRRVTIHEVELTQEEP